jgi:acyl-CoA reductase-like NAD-dependent aldehyde dehydrogenase
VSDSTPTTPCALRLAAGSGPELVVRNPATAETLGTVRSTTPADLDEVVATAVARRASWAATPVAQRARILAEVASAIRAQADRLARTLTLEQGKPLKESAIEVARTADCFEHWASLAEQLLAPSPRRVDGKAAFVLKRPVGVVAAVVPWNFPLTLLANKLVPALAAGNALVVKPAPTTPFATAAVLEMLEAAGVPAGAVGLVVGGADVGEALVRHPRVDLVSFTGSTATGRAIMAAAAPSVKRLVLELGGSDPMIVCDDADLDGAARAAAVGRYFNCGQACIAVKRLYVMEAVYEALLERLSARVAALEVGNGLDPGVRIGPQHTEAERAKSLGMIEDALDRGAKLLVGGSVPDAPGLQRGSFLQPTVLVEVPPDARVVTEECFGPVLPVVKVGSFEEALEAANRSVYGLGSSIWTKSADRAETAVAALDAGYTWVNDIATDYDAMPFGGVKQSGFGRERGVEGLEEYVALKSVVAGTLPEGMRAPEAAR